MRFILVLIIILGLFSCQDSINKENSKIVQTWLGREIQFPKEISFIGYGDNSEDLYKPTITKYAILTYIDSVGCFSCKLQLPEWEKFMNELSLAGLDDIPILFIFNPDDKQALVSLLRKVKFDYPIYMDTNGMMNRLNEFPSKMEFQTFLLDRDNKVVALGNPIHNPKVKELYLKILMNNEVIRPEMPMTEINLDATSIDFGSFPQTEKQECKFTLSNTGKSMLVIYDVVTSCGCTKVEYNKGSIRPGKTIELTVVYEAEEVGYFNKTIMVYCNAKNSPFRLRVTGRAE